MNETELSRQFLAMRQDMEEIHRQFEQVEARAMRAEKDAGAARDEIMRLRDQIAAAERDQQDLRSARARLARLNVRGLLARILNWQ